MKDRVPEVLRMGICNTVQEAMIKPPQEKDVQEDKVLSEEAFQTAEERGEVKGKGERER